MRAAWLRLSLRERRLLLIVGVFLLVVATFSLIWQPGRQRLEVVERQYQQQQALAAQLQRARPLGVVTDQPLSLRVSESVAAAGLELDQMEADNELLRLTLRGDAKRVLEWLDGVERGGALVQSMVLEKRDLVLEARVVLR
ncbi:type II secretion system protein GspM [Pseudomonas migulae]|uniref:type II secretion system protein GspM n=1 Tax=Pseudomonas migulae TaxID=78543 RepID=UPI0037128878